MRSRPTFAATAVRIASALVCLVLGGAAAGAQTQYTVTTLFDVAGLQSSHPLEINDHGEVVGVARFVGDDRAWGWRQDGGTIVVARRLLTFEGHAAPTLSGYMLARYFPSAAAPFERTRVVFDGVGHPITNPLLGGSETAVYGLDVNEAGQAVGHVLGFEPTLRGPLAFVWQNGTTTLLDSDGVTASVAVAINDQGMIAGTVLPSQSGSYQPAVWRDGERVALSSSNGTAHHVNNAGTVLGTFDVQQRAFLWKDGVFVDPCPGLAGQCSGMHLTEAGQALVRNFPRSYVFDGTTLTDVGVLGPDVGTFAHTMIDDGTVVGYSSRDASYVEARAFIYSGGTLRDLNDLLPPASGWTRLADAIGVNLSGQIVGVGIKDGIAKAFLLTPIP